MATVQSSIEGALLYRLSTLVLAPPLRIAWPNENFTPDGKKFLVVDHLPNQPDRPFLASDEPHFRQGILQVTVKGPLGEKAINFTEVAGLIAAHFPADLPMRRNGVTVKVSRAPTIATGLVDGPHWSVPVSINYECFA